VAGTYIIKVLGTRIQAVSGAGQTQDYAVVYGQKLPCSAADKETTEKIVSDPDRQIIYELNGHLANENTKVHPGTRIYMGEERIYLVGRYWNTSGVRAKTIRDGTVFVEIDPEEREGGYLAAVNELVINGINVNMQGYELSPGAEIRASLDPITQSLHQLNLYYNQVEGVISQVDEGMTRLNLVGNAKDYRLSENLSLIYDDMIKDTDAMDLSFGSPGEIQRFYSLRRGGWRTQQGKILQLFSVVPLI